MVKFKKLRFSAPLTVFLF